MGKVGGWNPTGFGARLRVLREERGISQREVGERAGCNSNTIAKLERGEQEPAWPLVLAIAKALGVDCTAFSAPAAAEPEPAEPPAAKKPKGKNNLPQN